MKTALFHTFFLVALAWPAFAEQTPQKLTLTRDITAGEVYEHTGPVEVIGNVGDGAQITIREGGLEIRGQVANGVTLDVEGVSAGRGGYSRQSITVVGDGALVVVNGQMVDVDGARVPLEGPVDVIVSGQIGADFKLISGTSAMLRDVGPRADIKVQNALSFRAMESGAKVKAGNSVDGNQFGGGVLEAGNSIKLKDIGRASDVAAGNTLKAGRIRANVKAHAGNSLKAARAHRSATLTAGNNVEVEEYY